MVAIGNEALYPQLKSLLEPEGIKVFAGAEAIAQLAAVSTNDMVLTSMVGFAGLLPTVRALEAGIPVALANKETLVVAGELIMDLARRKGRSEEHTSELQSRPHLVCRL